MYNFKKKNKGITLVALVVTIIVLLILAAVSINLVLGENGIITRAKTAKENTRGGDVRETVELAATEKQMVKYRTEREKTREEVIQELFDSKKITQDEKDKLLGENGKEKTDILTIGNITIDFSILNTIPTNEEQVKEEAGEKGYVGYYADTDGNGTVDGVIYADLAVGVSGQWADAWGDYSYSTTSNLKEYTVSQDSFTGDFGTKPVLKAVGSTGTDRFYVMALKDVALDGTFTASKDSVGWYWYNSASGNLDESMNTPNKGEGSDDFGQGKSKTKTMVTKWNGEADGTQNAKVVWNIFKDENNESGTIDTNKWFIPSKGEWSAFGGNLEITTTNYVNKRLSSCYWSSSQLDMGTAYRAYFSDGCMHFDFVFNFRYVRLSTTF